MNSNSLTYLVLSYVLCSNELIEPTLTGIEDARKCCKPPNPALPPGNARQFQLAARCARIGYAPFSRGTLPNPVGLAR